MRQKQKYQQPTFLQFKERARQNIFKILKSYDKSELLLHVIQLYAFIIANDIRYFE